EVAAALSRGLGDAALADEAVALLREKDFVRLFPVTDALAVNAAGVASARRIRGCDAVYVALAYELGMQLVAWDGQQLERGQGLVEALKPAAARDDAPGQPGGARLPGGTGREVPGPRGADPGARQGAGRLHCRQAGDLQEAPGAPRRHQASGDGDPGDA